MWRHCVCVCKQLGGEHRRRLPALGCCVAIFMTSQNLLTAANATATAPAPAPSSARLSASAP